VSSPRPNELLLQSTRIVHNYSVLSCPILSSYYTLNVPRCRQIFPSGVAKFPLQPPEHPQQPSLVKPGNANLCTAKAGQSTSTVLLWVLSDFPTTPKGKCAPPPNVRKLHAS